MIRFTDENRIKKILVYGIVIMSISLIIIIGMNMNNRNNGGIDFFNEGSSNEENPVVMDEIINPDVKLFETPRIDEEILNILLIVDETNKKNQISSSGFYIISLDSREDKIKIVTIYPYMMIDAFNREGLVLGEVRENCGVNSTVNIINNHFKLDISRYVVVDYGDISYFMQFLEMQKIEEDSKLDLRIFGNRSATTIEINKLKGDIFLRVLLDNADSMNPLNVFLAQTSLLSEIYNEMRTLLIPVMVADIAESLYHRVETNFDVLGFHRIFIRIANDKSKEKTLELPIKDAWGYLDSEKRTVKPHLKNKLSIRGFLYN